jgi:putative FmdB family regulatory protein
MPIYEYRCEPCGKTYERALPVARRNEPQECTCGALCVKVLSPVKGFVQRDCCYDSPIDGRHITNRAQRRDDMDRHGCMEYEPGMKQDTERKRRDAEVQLERAAAETVERHIETLPTPRRERLANEIAAGATAEIVRKGA